MLAIMATIVAAGSPSRPANAAGIEKQGLCERYVSRAARNYGIPLGVLYAVGLTESGKKGNLHPYAMNIAGEARFPDTVEKAMRELHDAQRRGVRLIDVGCMQINHYYHRENFSSDRAMFDPARNVEYAASFLKSLKKQHKTWAMAVARYHAGPDNNVAQKQYVCRVIRNMVASGAGKWTPAAKKFCNSG